MCYTHVLTGMCMSAIRAFVPGFAGIPKTSVVVMTDADWAGDVKDRHNYSGVSLWGKCSVANTWYPVYAFSKKQNLFEFW